MPLTNTPNYVKTHSSSLYLSGGWRSGQKLWGDGRESSLPGSEYDSFWTCFFFFYYSLDKWKAKTQWWHTIPAMIYGFLIWPNLCYMLQGSGNAVSLEWEGERGWKLSLSLVSFLSFFCLFLSLTNQLYHILSLSVFFLLLQAYIHSRTRQWRFEHF